MNLFDHVDLYCERLDASLWAEPVNALTNLAFIAAGLLLWRRAAGPLCGELRLLASLLALIGVCSGLFHVFGTVWGMLLDVLGIALFIAVYIHRYLRRVAGWPLWACGAGVAAFIAADRGIAAWSAVVGDVGLNGSEGYLLPGALLFAFALWARRQAPLTARWLAAAGGVFIVSLTLRTLDAALCPQWPLGTHFAWHLLNAVVLYCRGRALAASAPPAPPLSAPQR